MDITSENFNEKIEFINKCIAECTYMAIDTELTGLSSSSDQQSMRFHTPSQRYNHLLRHSTSFLIVQFGLTTFKCRSFCSDSLEYNSFNFYLFPTKPHKSSREKIYSLQPSTFQFLTSNGFDFNKTFKHGIQFMPISELKEVEQKLTDELQLDLRRLHEKQGDRTASTEEKGDGVVTSDLIEVPPSYSKFLDDSCARVRKELLEDTATDKKAYIDFSGLNGYQRKILYDHMPVILEKQVMLSTCTHDSQKVLRVARYMDPDKHKAHLKKLMYEKLDSALGFSFIIRKIVSAKKPIVGHNMFLDLVHITNHFMCSLPASLGEFKTLASSCFQCLYDTKVLATTVPFSDVIRSSQLSNLFDAVKASPFHFPALVCDTEHAYDTDNRDKAHEAGFDSLMTGIVFHCLIKYLGKLNLSDQENISLTKPLCLAFANKIYMAGTFDIPYVNLASQSDTIPDRGNLLYMQMNNCLWTTFDIKKLFKPYEPIRIMWDNSKSAFISLGSKHNGTAVCRKLFNHQGFSLITYKQYLLNKKDKKMASSSQCGQACAQSPLRSDMEEEDKNSKKTCIDSPLSQSRMSQSSEDRKRMDSDCFMTPMGSGEDEFPVPDIW